jgi:two-component system NtrC family sensor kinase
MRIPLHIKTTALVSVAIIIVMVVTVAIFGPVVVGRIQREQKEYAEAQAENLSEKIADVLPLNDYTRVVRLVEIFDQARLKKDANDGTRVWEVNGVTFTKRAGYGESVAGADLPPEAAAALIDRKEVKIEDTEKGVYRVFVPVISRGSVVGAVEFAEELDTFAKLANRYWLIGISLICAFIALSALAVYILTGIFVNRPLQRIADAIGRFKEGDLEMRADVGGRDEFGVLGNELNLMFAQIEEFTKERDRQNELLELRVGEATEELQTRYGQLERANLEIWQMTSRLSKLENLAAAGQTAAQFAHEVGTPLNLISGHVQLLRNEIPEDDPARKRLEVIGAQISRIEGIVRSMLDKTRFGESGHEAVDVNRVLSGIREVVEPKLTSAGIDFAFEPADGLPTVQGDPSRLQQVFLNLIGNASDAMPDGGSLTVRTRLDGGKVIVEIADTGTGMDEEVLKHIFEPFFTTKPRGEGTGVGLAVVRQILNEHGARVGVDSEKGKGSRFLITFPGKEEPEKK